MGTYTYNAEYTSSVPPQRLFKALVLDADNLFPKWCPTALRALRTLKEMEGLEM